MKLQAAVSINPNLYIHSQQLRLEDNVFFSLLLLLLTLLFLFFSGEGNWLPDSTVPTSVRLKGFRPLLTQLERENISTLGTRRKRLFKTSICDSILFFHKKEIKKVDSEAIVCKYCNCIITNGS